MKSALVIALSFVLFGCLSKRSNPFGPCVLNEEHHTMSIGCVGKGTDCPLTKEEIAIAKKNIVSYIYSEFGEYGKIFKENEMFSGRHINSKTNCRVYISGNSIDYIHPEHVVFYSKKSLMVEKIYKVQW